MRVISEYREVMRRSLLVLLFFVMWPQHIWASEPAYDSLPPELLELQSQGNLTVRALWAWKLVPEATAQMALEFRSLGHDLLAAKREQLMTWLKQAEEGQIQLSQQQKDILTLLAERMNTAGNTVPVETAQGQPAENGGAETHGTAQDSSPSAAVPQIVEADHSATGQNVDTTDTAQLVVGLSEQAEAGNSKAMLTLALITKTDVAGPPDPYKSIKLLEDAAAAGEADAMALLADEYASGLWIKQDMEKANQLRQQAAAAGSRLAQWEVE